MPTQVERPADRSVASAPARRRALRRTAGVLSLLGLLPSMVATTQCRQGIDEMISVAIGMVLAQFPAAMYAIAATAWRRGVKYGAILALGVAMPFVFAAWMFSGLCG